MIEILIAYAALAVWLHPEACAEAIRRAVAAFERALYEH